MKLQSADDIIINPPNQKQSALKQPSRAPPTSNQLIKQVTVGDYPYALCQYKGYTYVGCFNGAVDRIDEGGNVTSSFIKLPGRVVGIDAYEDRLYSLIRRKLYQLVLASQLRDTVYVHDLTGRQLHSWKHEDRTDYLGRALAFINNELIIAGRNNNRFTIYTLTGKRVRDVPCDLVSHSCSSVCHVGDDSVLVANKDAKSGLYRVNLTTGDVVWRSDRVNNPIGIVMYSKDVALVTSFSYSNHVKIWTLNADTGM